MPEKLVFLKREEIRTMAKDLARLQEQEAIKEKERISKLELEEKLPKEAAEREKIIKTMIPDQAKTEEKTITNEEQIAAKITKTSVWKKVLIRIAIIVSFLAFLFFLGFVYWYLIVKKKPAPEPTPSQSASISPLPESPALSQGSPAPSPTESVNPEIPPMPIITVKEIKIIELNQEESAEDSLKKSIGEIILTDANPEFFEILPKKEGEFWGLAELASGIGLKLPKDIFSSVSRQIEDFDFNVYGKNNSKQGFALIVKVTDQENLLKILSAWEPTMPDDLRSLFAILDKQTTLVNNVFRQAKYGDAVFRYFSFKEKDLGICWSSYQNYLIITSSGEIMYKTVDLIKSK